MKKGGRKEGEVGSEGGREGKKEGRKEGRREGRREGGREGQKENGSGSNVKKGGMIQEISVVHVHLFLVAGSSLSLTVQSSSHLSSSARD